MLRVINAEWQKIFFVRSSRIYLLSAIIGSILIGLTFSLTTQVTQGRALGDLEAIEIISVNILGVDVVTLFVLLFIAVQTGREFHTKSIHCYLSVNPSRRRYFLSKALFFLIFSFAVGVLVAVVTLLDGHLLVFLTHKEMPPVGVVWQFIAGCVVMPVFYSLLTLNATFITRNTASGIVIPSLVMLLPVLTKVLPGSLQFVITPVLPASAIHTLSGIAENSSGEYIGILGALLSLGAWTMFSSLLAICRFQQVDI